MPFRCPHCHQYVSTKSPGDLTGHEQELFDILVAANGRYLAVDYLIYELWLGKNRYEPEDSANALNVYIRRIRKKRGQLSILNRRGIGFAYSKDHDNEALGTYRKGLEQVQARPMA